MYRNWLKNYLLDTLISAIALADQSALVSGVLESNSIPVAWQRQAAR
jgi:hypothetical protein